jgi:transcriptional regulator with XRE-family HTH domain
MARNFKELQAQMSAERQQRNALAASRTLLDMTLQELRQDVAHMSQADLAEALTVTQGYISRVERQGDMLLSKLYAYVRALGGEVEIRAKLPGHKEVRITQFQGLDRLGEELGR